MDLRQLTPDLSVSPQIQPSEVEELARAGFRTLINNRPDAEVGPDEDSTAMAEAARRAGMAYHHIPFNPGQVTPDMVRDFAAATGGAGPAFAYCRSGNRSAVLWALTQAGVLLFRGLATDRLPWGNMYEFGTATVLIAVVVYTIFAVRVPALRHLGLFVLAPVVVALVLIGLFLYADAGPLVAALRSYWLAIHVTTAIIGFGIFFVSGIASVMYLVRSRYEARLADGAAPESGVVAKLPTAAALDRVAHRTAVFGFPIWTFAVIAGAISCGRRSAIQTKRLPPPSASNTCADAL